MREGIRVVDLIARKRDGEELSSEELHALVRAHLADEMDDAQMAAFLMAGVVRGFTSGEAVALTEALLASGEVVDLDSLPGPTVDKHSTGGVGDTATLIVAPLLAACGCQVAKLSGRGLGHTGGTLDKLEAIPGLEVDLSSARFREQVQAIGLAVGAAGPTLAPADRRLYALRDVTATVASPALIASSIMSKKLAGGASHVLLDVKVGDGAFLATHDDATDLAALCVEIGRSQGRRTGALLTQMSEPLGDAVGNALEVAAAVAVLQGGGSSRLREVSLALTAACLRLTGRSEEEAPRIAEEALRSGAGLERFRDLVIAQSGPPEVADGPWKCLPGAPEQRDWIAPPGVVTHVDARALGMLAGRLGAGRSRQGEAVDPAVGVEVFVRRGDRVDADTPAARVHARSAGDAASALEELSRVVAVGEGPVDPLPLVLSSVGVATDGGVASPEA